MLYKLFEIIYYYFKKMCNNIITIVSYFVLIFCELNNLTFQLYFLHTFKLFLIILPLILMDELFFIFY